MNIFMTYKSVEIIFSRITIMEERKIIIFSVDLILKYLDLNRILRQNENIKIVFYIKRLG
jgi:hypothetical protein